MNTVWKHRLVGGFTLLVALVLLVPLVFTGQGRLPQARLTDIPEAPVLAPAPAVNASEAVKETDTSARVDRIFGLADEGVAPRVPGPDDAGSDSESRPEPTERGGPDPVASLPVDPEGEVEAWSVQLGSFNKADNARRLLERVRAAGYEGYTRDSILSDGSTLIQVMVGPGTEIEAVRTLESQLSKEFNLSALVVRFRP